MYACIWFARETTCFIVYNVSIFYEREPPTKRVALRWDFTLCSNLMPSDSLRVDNFILFVRFGFFRAPSLPVAENLVIDVERNVSHQLPHGFSTFRTLFAQSEHPQLIIFFFFFSHFAVTNLIFLWHILEVSQSADCVFAIVSDFWCCFSTRTLFSCESNLLDLAIQLDGKKVWRSRCFLNHRCEHTLNWICSF